MSNAEKALDVGAGLSVRFLEPDPGDPRYPDVVENGDPIRPPVLCRDRSCKPVCRVRGYYTDFSIGKKKVE